ncbi:hypothetical protein [Thermococcus sp. PK]|nr:hypothetical protein [Thermococcus sp. PK]ALV63819.1 hypothetical protein ADU37_CDS21220 [Thermococcus sp. 2319x1]MDK2854406.1 hypothetical protein [Thermococcaceae archaeon]
MWSYKFEKETVLTAGVAVNRGAMIIGEHYKIVPLKLNRKGRS